jgi:hypothetical protein
MTQSLRYLPNVHASLQQFYGIGNAGVVAVAFDARHLDLVCNYHFLEDIDWPCSSSQRDIAAGSKRTMEPIRNDGILPRLARRIVTFVTLSNSASSSAVKARTRDARHFN